MAGFFMVFHVVAVDGITSTMRVLNLSLSHLHAYLCLSVHISASTVALQPGAYPNFFVIIGLMT